MGNHAWDGHEANGCIDRLAWAEQRTSELLLTDGDQCGVNGQQASPLMGLV